MTASQLPHKLTLPSPEEASPQCSHQATPVLTAPRPIFPYRAGLLLSVALIRIHMGHCVPVLSLLALVHPTFCPRLPLFSAIFGSNDSYTHGLQFLSICPLCEMSLPVFAQHIGFYTRSPKVFSSQPCSYLSLWRHSAW